MVNRPVAEASKDPDYRYDGNYVATVRHSGGIQFIDQWHINCATQDFNFRLHVEESVVYIDDFNTAKHNGEDRQSGFVDRDGRFRFQFDTDRSIRAYNSSDDTIFQAKITLILQGKLSGEKPFGYYAEAVREFVNRGCSYRMYFERI